MNNNSHLIPLGSLGKPYRFSGELHFFPYNEETDIVFKDMDVFIGKDVKNVVSFFVEDFNFKRRILKFKDINTKELALTLSKKKLFVLRSQMPILSDDSYYLVDLIGCLVVSDDKKMIGIVNDVLNLPANDVIVVDKEGKELLIPLIDDIIKFIDIENKRIEIIVLPGLL